MAWMCCLTDVEWDITEPLSSWEWQAPWQEPLSVSLYTACIDTSIHQLWWSIDASTAHCLSDCDATSAKLYRYLLFPWTTPVLWRGEACYMHGQELAFLLRLPKPGGSTSVCRSMVCLRPKDANNNISHAYETWIDKGVSSCVCVCVCVCVHMYQACLHVLHEVCFRMLQLHAWVSVGGRTLFPVRLQEQCLHCGFSCK